MRPRLTAEGQNLLAARAFSAGQGENDVIGELSAMSFSAGPQTAGSDDDELELYCRPCLEQSVPREMSVMTCRERGCQELCDVCPTTWWDCGGIAKCWLPDGHFDSWHECHAYGRLDDREKVNKKVNISVI